MQHKRTLTTYQGNYKSGKTNLVEPILMSPVVINPCEYDTPEDLRKLQTIRQPNRPIAQLRTEISNFNVFATDF